jgi:hypothetical protein
VNGNDEVVRQPYDRHYSRPKASIGKAQFKRPGFNLRMKTKEGDACWISWRSIFPRKDGYEAYESSQFRNESQRISSSMIKWAVYATIQQWGAIPTDGFITYVSDDHVESQNKGCL